MGFLPQQLFIIASAVILVFAFDLIKHYLFLLKYSSKYKYQLLSDFPLLWSGLNFSIYLVLVVLFLLFIYEAKRRKRKKKKRKHVIFLRPSGVLIEWLFSATPNLLASLVASLDALQIHKIAQKKRTF